MRALAISLLALFTAGCSGLDAGAGARLPEPFSVEATGSPFVRVTSGAVSGLVPAGWAASPLPAGDRSGFVAAPRSGGAGGPIATGLSATWVDATRIGVPSDFYYLVATGPSVAPVAAHPSCVTTRSYVFADHPPAFLAGRTGSPGDFVARASGTCELAGTAARWVTFVAAPGFGSARSLGIPASGLYVVSAIAPDVPGARARLNHLVGSVRFGGTRIQALAAAVVPT
jgi:hypothetical protein